MAQLRQELEHFTPFAQMDGADIDFFVRHSKQHYFAPQDLVVGPSSGVVAEIHFIRRGAVTVAPYAADAPDAAFQHEAGDLFPLGAALAARAVVAPYRAVADTFVLTLPTARMQQLAQQCPAFADFLNGRIQTFLNLSRQALQRAYSSQTLAEQSLETSLGALIRGQPVCCAPDTPVGEALQTIHTKRIGSILVVDADGQVVGILTRHDVVDRIALAQVALATPIAQVMVLPVQTLTTEHTAQDAALLMARHSIRHVPVTRDGRVAGILSERDLFALQRVSLQGLSASARASPDLPALQLVAQQIRRFARNLLSQGVQARQLTALISHLNDVLTERLLVLKAQQHQMDLRGLCWLALGSEGRSEQTIATDQDNALILTDATSAPQREAARAFAQDVNEALDALGFPLCKGGIMAGQAACCLTLGEWRARFAGWLDHGAPADLLNASIYFDFRVLAGDAQLATVLRLEVAQAARQTPRFLKQLALNALTRTVPLNWLGGLETDGQGAIDLKQQGTAVFVEAARVYALAHGVAATNTRERFEAVGKALGIPQQEYEAWSGAFEFLQMLRLRVQLDAAAALGNPNHLALASLNDIDRRILKEAFRVGKSLQQRLHMDYSR
jgi:CBS domain-containing protein